MILILTVGLYILLRATYFKDAYRIAFYFCLIGVMLIPLGMLFKLYVLSDILASMVYTCIIILLVELLINQKTN